MKTLSKQMSFHFCAIMKSLSLFCAFSIEREELMELDTEQEEMEGKMHCYFSIFFYAIIGFITIVNWLLYFMCIVIWLMFCFGHLSFFVFFFNIIYQLLFRFNFILNLG